MKYTIVMLEKVERFVTVKYEADTLDEAMVAVEDGDGDVVDIGEEAVSRVFIRMEGSFI